MTGMEPWTLMTEPTANDVWDVLVELAGAHESGRSEFIHHQTDRVCDEYRFMGSIGFGGKFRRNVGRRQDGTWGEVWYVDAYPEDMTDEHRAIITATGLRLDELLRVHETAPPAHQ